MDLEHRGFSCTDSGRRNTMLASRDKVRFTEIPPPRVALVSMASVTLSAGIKSIQAARSSRLNSVEGAKRA